MESKIEAVTDTEPDNEGLVDGDLVLLPVTESMLETVGEDEIEAEAESEDVRVLHAVVDSEPLLDPLTEADTLWVTETDPLDEMLPVIDTLPVVDTLSDDELHDVVVPDREGLDDRLVVTEDELVPLAVGVNKLEYDNVADAEAECAEIVAIELPEMLPVVDTLPDDDLHDVVVPD